MTGSPHFRRHSRFKKEEKSFEEILGSVAVSYLSESFWGFFTDGLVNV